MDHGATSSLLHGAAYLFGFALVSVLLFRRLGLGATLGYLVAGALVGPQMLGLVSGGETMMLDEVRAAIARHGLAGCLDLYTQRRGVDGMMAADVLLTTSRYEGMSYALLEAGALGLPIVTTEVGDSVAARVAG